MPENGISEFELSAWLLGALDPDRAEELAQAVARSPALAARAKVSDARMLPVTRYAPSSGSAMSQGTSQIEPSVTRRAEPPRSPALGWRG